jgi:hypothetical protein
VKALFFFGGGHKTRYYCSCISYMQSADKLLVDGRRGTLSLCCKLQPQPLPRSSTGSVDQSLEVACFLGLKVA